MLARQWKIFFDQVNGHKTLAVICIDCLLVLDRALAFVMFGRKCHCRTPEDRLHWLVKVGAGKEKRRAGGELAALAAFGGCALRLFGDERQAQALVLGGDQRAVNAE